MNQFIGIIIRLLSICVVLVNWLYIQHVGAPSLNSYMNFVMPYLKYVIGAIVIGGLILLLNNGTTIVIKLSVLLIILLATFPLYHDYLRSFF